MTKKQLTVYMTLGMPGSGKSTWAREQCDNNPGKYKILDKDSLRDLLDNGSWSKKNERFVVKIQESIILQALEDGYDVIVHDTNFGGHLDRIRKLVEGKAEVIVKDFTHVSPEECIERDLKRPRSVGSKVIWDMYNRYLKPKPSIIEYDDSLKDCLIVDIDGTVAKFNGRGPYDWNKVDTDNPNWPVIEFVESYKFANPDVEIIFMSGRDSVCRDLTERWLDFYIKIPYYHLFMRPQGDMRKDSIVKLELYDKHIRGKYNCKAVLDDRAQVVKVWRELGLTCLQVADGEF